MLYLHTCIYLCHLCAALLINATSPSFHSLIIIFLHNAATPSVARGEGENLGQCCLLPSSLFLLILIALYSFYFLFFLSFFLLLLLLCIHPLTSFLLCSSFLLLFFFSYLFLFIYSFYILLHSSSCSSSSSSSYAFFHLFFTSFPSPFLSSMHPHLTTIPSVSPPRPFPPSTIIIFPFLHFHIPYLLSPPFLIFPFILSFLISPHSLTHRLIYDSLLYLPL